MISVTLHDIVHTEKSLTLVFEYLDKDLKQYMDDCRNILSMNNVKVSIFSPEIIPNRKYNGKILYDSQ